MGSIVINNNMACQTSTGSNCFLTYATNISGRKLEWHLIVGRKGSLLKLIKFQEMKGCSMELKSKTYLSKKIYLHQSKKRS